MNNLEKIIKGSRQIIDAIDSGKNVNVQRCIKAAMINSIVLAEEILKYRSPKEDPQVVKDIFSMFK
jgi:hypothetical protein